ncbi:MAG: hypothetical protein Q8L15_20685 [Methylobacter sp.]|nr:hypothetical protein [Methylobacter sp.]
MKKAHYGSINGPMVEPKEFFDKATPEHRKRGIFPYCDSCREVVHLYGVHTPNPNTTPRFDHADIAPDADPLDDCILANRNQRYRGLEPDGWDDSRGAVMRKRFFEDDNLAQAYAFCLNLCRHGNLPKVKFLSMLNRADRKRVWAYVDIPLWSIPYVLLTLENFTDKKKGYEFHFSFIKPVGSNIAALWQNPEECKIVKLFSSNSKVVETSDNPYPVSEKAILDKAGDTSWIRPGFLQ